VGVVNSYDEHQGGDVTEPDPLTEQFEKHRDRLRAVAFRMLGSSYEADDAVQETWLRLNRSDAEAVDNLGGWLTAVVARVCLDMLRSRNRKERHSAESIPETDPAPSPEEEALLADSVGLALLVVLDTLEPAERLAFVLHDMFAISFDQIAVVVGRSPVAARQLASRARRRVQSDPAVPDTSATTQREVVAAFLAAARHGDFAGLIQLLDPDVVVRADAVAVEMASARASAGAPALKEEMYGVDAVTRVFAGGAKAARLTLVDGLAGAVVSVGVRPIAVFSFTMRERRIAGIELISDPEVLSMLELESVPTGDASVASDN
jgi:RNA polymerase sigma factor (sigma-70 family)